MQTLLHDLRYAVRQLRKTPGLTVLAVLSLTLGIGANTAIFTIIESVLLRPLPYAHADRLVFIGPAERQARVRVYFVAELPGYRRPVEVVGVCSGLLRRRKRSAGQRRLAKRGRAAGDDQFIFHAWRASIAGPYVHRRRGPNRRAARRAAFGRLMAPDLRRRSRHRREGGENRRHAAHGALGSCRSSFHFPEGMGPDLQKGVWLPVQPTGEMLKDRGYHFFNVVADLRPGVSIAQAQQELDAIAAHIPRKDSDDVIRFHATPYQEVLTGPVRPVLYGLFGALALVLLIACANVSNLLIARCLGRQQEFAVRAALGGGRWRLARQMLSEGLLLSLIGCGAGVMLARAAMIAVSKLPEGTIPRADSIAIHWTVVLVLAAIAVVVTALSSLLPALLVARSNPQAALQSASRGLGSHSVSGKLSGGLVAGEVALSTLLLVGTGLLFHTLWNLEKSQLGFDAARVTTFTAMPADAAGFSGMAVSEAGANAPVSVATLTYQPVLDRIRQVPGIESAALVTSPPLSGVDMGTSFEIRGASKGSGKQARSSYQRRERRLCPDHGHPGPARPHDRRRRYGDNSICCGRQSGLRQEVLCRTRILCRNKSIWAARIRG